MAAYLPPAFYDDMDGAVLPVFPSGSSTHFSVPKTDPPDRHQVLHDVGALLSTGDGAAMLVLPGDLSRPPVAKASTRLRTGRVPTLKKGTAVPIPVSLARVEASGIERLPPLPAGWVFVNRPVRVLPFEAVFFRGGMLRLFHGLFTPSGGLHVVHYPGFPATEWTDLEEPVVSLRRAWADVAAHRGGFYAVAWDSACGPPVVPAHVLLFTPLTGWDPEDGHLNVHPMVLPCVGPSLTTTRAQVELCASMVRQFDMPMTLAACTPSPVAVPVNTPLGLACHGVSSRGKPLGHALRPHSLSDADGRRCSSARGVDFMAGDERVCCVALPLPTRDPLPSPRHLTIAHRTRDVVVVTWKRPVADAMVGLLYVVKAAFVGLSQYSSFPAAKSGRRMAPRAVASLTRQHHLRQLWTGSALVLEIPSVFYAAIVTVTACGPAGEGAPSQPLLIHPLAHTTAQALPPALQGRKLPRPSEAAVDAAVKRRRAGRDPGATPTLAEGLESPMQLYRQAMKARMATSPVDDSRTLLDIDEADQPVLLPDPTNAAARWASSRRLVVSQASSEAGSTGTPEPVPLAPAARKPPPRLGALRRGKPKPGPDLVSPVAVVSPPRRGLRREALPPTLRPIGTLQPAAPALQPSTPVASPPPSRTPRLPTGASAGSPASHSSMFSPVSLPPTPTGPYCVWAKPRRGPKRNPRRRLASPQAVVPPLRVPTRPAGAPQTSRPVPVSSRHRLAGVASPVSGVPMTARPHSLPALGRPEAAPAQQRPLQPRKPALPALTASSRGASTAEGRLRRRPSSRATLSTRSSVSAGGPGDPSPPTDDMAVVRRLFTDGEFEACFGFREKDMLACMEPVYPFVSTAPLVAVVDLLLTTLRKRSRVLVFGRQSCELFLEAVQSSLSMCLQNLSDADVYKEVRQAVWTLLGIVKGAGDVVAYCAQPNWVTKLLKGDPTPEHRLRQLDAEAKATFERFASVGAGMAWRMLQLPREYVNDRWERPLVAAYLESTVANSSLVSRPVAPVSLLNQLATLLQLPLGDVVSGIRAHLEAPRRRKQAV